MTPIYKLNIKFKSGQDSALAPLDIWTSRTLFFPSLEETAKAEVSLKALGVNVLGHSIEHLITSKDAVEYITEIMMEEGK